MKTSDFYYELPPELIARYPSEERGDDRLMVLDRAARSCAHHRVGDLPDLIPPGSLLVFNDSRVRKARLFATDAAGREAEFLLVKKIDGTSWQALVRRSKRRKPGTVYQFAAGLKGVIADGNAGSGQVTLLFEQPLDEAWLDAHGHVPLPPYIKRRDELSDAFRYQTVYAKETGSAAAPTAGLHFTDALLAALRERGIETAFITLHVGLGTFLPVRVAHIEEHIMHEEAYTIDDAAAEKIERAQAEGRRVIAVGTTSLRTLESAWQQGKLRRGEGATAIFIYPPYQCKIVNGLFTNFHTPESTLLMLTAAFAGLDFMLAAYRSAVAERYRFFSYGDAMLIL